MATTDTALKNSLIISATFVGLLWLIKLCEILFNTPLHQLGIYPHSASGLVGIIAAPLIHGSFSHLLANSLPLFILVSALFYGYPKSWRWVLGLIWLLSGLGVWLFARQSYHFGASGLTHGLFFYLFISGLLRRDTRSIVLLMITFFMYGGMLATVFPSQPGISFEYHLFGAAAGILAALLFRQNDPKPAEKVYSWEQQGDEEEDPIIGDEWKIESDESAKTSSDD